MLGALLFAAVVFGWALVLGRTMGGNGSWLPGEKAPVPTPEEGLEPADPRPPRG